MNEYQAFILGLIQGLTEFLPVSSSGHIEMGHKFLRIEDSDNLWFAINVHAATVLSTLLVFRKNITEIFSGIFKRGWNEDKSYLIKLIIANIPVIFVGLFLADWLKSVFSQNMLLVGFSLIFTSVLLTIAHFMPSGNKKITYSNSFIIGISQAIAVLPGISRSGATISTGLMLRTNRSSVAQFSFLMVIIPIVGAFGWELVTGNSGSTGKIGIIPMIVGFVTAFITGLLACSWMIKIVRNGKLIYFGIYCLIVGLIAIFAA